MPISPEASPEATLSPRSSGGHAIDNPTQQLFAVTVFGYKKPGMELTDYHEYISHTHAGHLKALLARNDIVSYTMQHNTPQSNGELLERVFENRLPSHMISDCDALIQIVFKHMDDYVRVREDDHFRNVVNPDHHNFADPVKTRFSSGWFEVHVQNGQVVS